MLLYSSYGRTKDLYRLKIMSVYLQSKTDLMKVPLALFATKSLSMELQFRIYYNGQLTRVT